MSVPILQLIQGNRRARTNEFGEVPLAFAPTISLANGQQAVPQQYLDVERNLDNLANVLACVSIPDGYQLFAGQEGSGLYLIVGVFGKENYPASPEIAAQTKLVYGRRWLIEDTAPTSEIVQTAMLAVKKAREHEVRELLTLRVGEAKRVTTPFNCHLDLPLMAGNRTEFACQAVVKPIDELLAQVRIDGQELRVVASQMVGSRQVFEVTLLNSGEPSHFPELSGGALTVVCEHGDGGDFLHQLCRTLIHASDRFIEENVSFDGFKRFSHELCPEKLGDFSSQTRNVAVTDARFDTAFKDMSYRVDAAKAPRYNNGILGQQQRSAVDGYSELAGYLPHDAN